MSKINNIFYFALGSILAVIFWLNFVVAQEIVVIDEGAYFDERFATSTLSYEKQEEITYIERKLDALIEEQQKTNYWLYKIYADE